jgi:hypothetical protein
MMEMLKWGAEIERPFLAQSGRSRGPLSGDVRFRGKTGRHLLVLSFSQFDPERTLARAKPTPRLVIPLPGASGHADHSGSPALRSIDVISAAHSGLRAFI